LVIAAQVPDMLLAFASPAKSIEDALERRLNMRTGKSVIVRIFCRGMVTVTIAAAMTPTAARASSDKGVVPGPAGAAGSKIGVRSGAEVPAEPTTPGERLWTKRYNGVGDYQDDPSALGVSPDGAQVFVTGSSYGSTNNLDYATVAYDSSTGARPWATRYEGSGHFQDESQALGVSPDGAQVFVTGSSYGSTSSTDYATVAYDSSTGAKLWAKRYNGPTNGEDGASALGVSPDGAEVFVTGYSQGSTSGDYATVAYDSSTGAKLWAKRYNGPANGGDSARALGVSTDGTRVFVTGDSGGSTSSTDYATVAYDASTGARLWATRYNGPANDHDFVSALGVSPDGAEVFVTGGSYGPNYYLDYATVAYSAV
jgi:hypothetical protein